MPDVACASRGSIPSRPTPPTGGFAGRTLDDLVPDFALPRDPPDRLRRGRLAVDLTVSRRPGWPTRHADSHSG
jgi:hypothetical protein